MDQNTASLVNLILAVDLAEREDLIARARSAFLDYAAALLAARDIPAAKKLRRLSEAENTRAAEALLYGFGSHYLDYDDAQANLRGHFSTVIYSALLAVANAKDSAADFLAAYVAGAELEGLLGEQLNPAHRNQGWHSTGTIGVLGAAAAIGRLRRLQTLELAQLLSLSATQSGGMLFESGSEAKPLHAGFAAAAAVRAYQLLKLGITARTNPFNDDNGWLRTIGGIALDLERIESAWLRPGQLISPGLWMKKHQYCSAAICALAGVKQLYKEGLRLEQLASLEFHFPTGADAALHYQRPQTGKEGQFSVEYPAWQVLMFGAVDDELFQLSEVPAEFLAALPKFRRVYDVPPVAKTVRLTPVTATSLDGRRWSADVRDPAGSPTNPFTYEQQLAKLSAASNAEWAEAFGRLVYDSDKIGMSVALYRLKDYFAAGR